MCLTVPSAPRSLQLILIEEDPPVVNMTWQAPVVMHGTLTGYQLIYGIRDDELAERRHFEADKQQFTTKFLGKSYALLHTDLSNACRVYFKDFFGLRNTPLSCLPFLFPLPFFLPSP